MTARSITWEQFAVCNTEGKGLQLRFEDLCRQLFCNEFLKQNKKNRYLHANPNNPGLETEPIFDEVNQRWIGFQAKFFDHTVDYNQILSSAKMTAKHYSGKVSHVYLFCNLPLTTSSEGYKKIVNVLSKESISLEPITNDAVLDMVRKYDYLALYYFEKHLLDWCWFKKHTLHMIDNLGERFNGDFNVETVYSRDLAFFVHSPKAVAALNRRKIELSRAIDNYIDRGGFDAYLKKIEEGIHQLPDIDHTTILDAIEWKSKISDYVKIEKECLIKTKEGLENELQRARDRYDKYLDASTNGKEQNETNRSLAQKERLTCDRLANRIDAIINILALTDILAVTQDEKDLLLGRCLRIKGNAGNGKSQLLAKQTNDLIAANNEVLLLLAGNYYTDEPIQQQIVHNLSISLSFSDLIDVLEAIGEEKGQIVPVFIDALNETWNHGLWKSGLLEIIDKIIDSPYVKLVLSYRSEYETQLFNEMTKLRLKEYGVEIVHAGFAGNAIEAARQFLNYYSIPFSPLEYFSIEISNPLFLTLYCKTYNGTQEGINLSVLYERILKRANDNIHRVNSKMLREKGYEEDCDIVAPFIMELAEHIIKTGKRFFSRKEISKMSYWTDYAIPVPVFIGLLTKEGILHNYRHGEEEVYYFAYDQMNDYYCAKTIFILYHSKETIKAFLRDTILGIQEGKIRNYGNVELFINACAAYAEKYQEECIDLIDDINNDSQLIDVFDRYITSYQWRNPTYVNPDELWRLMKTHDFSQETLWEMFIVNSIKPNHPLNANCLHDHLMQYKLNDRDYRWTEYINELPDHTGNRIVELMQMYNKGEILDHVDQEQTKLLLTLFTWLLTSSDRWMRDMASKAMIEILKREFALCETIIQKFQKVNDPYVIQRLYGIVFGACCKRTEEDMQEFQSLAEYVYDAIFDQQYVYPDILLRDYARMIIERFVWELPAYKGRIDRRKVRPPYASLPIPDSVDDDFLSREYTGGLYRIISSLRFEGMGMYGDFGRYVFQYALSDFEGINREIIFNYAMHLIIHKCGYTEKQFGVYDMHVGRGYHDRHDTAKRERIGKKYQWIAMYNILARVSDHNEMKTRWDDDLMPIYQGAWEPYVRDFDPTLNEASISCSDVPLFEILQQHKDAVEEENSRDYPIGEKAEKEWIDKKTVFFDYILKDLILEEPQGSQWVVLTRYTDTGRRHLDNEKLLIWSWIRGYFVTEEQVRLIAKGAEEGCDFSSTSLNDGISSYKIYNREYPWAPSCEDIRRDSWKELKVNTGVYETIIEKYEPSPLLDILRQYGLGDNSKDDQESKEELLMPDNNTMSAEPMTARKVPIPKSYGKVLTATADLLWEGVYDASKKKPISWTVPCPEIIDSLNLRQRSSDCMYYDQAGNLAAFDSELSGQPAGFVIRRDLLDTFLMVNNLKLIWFANADKEVHLPTRETMRWSEWTSLLIYDGIGVRGRFDRVSSNYGR